MWRLLKLIFYVVVLATLALVGYAYVGPILDPAFMPSQETVTVPVELDFD